MKYRIVEMPAKMCAFQVQKYVEHAGWEYAEAFATMERALAFLENIQKPEIVRFEIDIPDYPMANDVLEECCTKEDCINGN